MTDTSTVDATAISKTFTRDQVADALIAAGNNPKATDSDIRRLTNIHFHMIANGLGKIDTEILDDESSIKLLDYFAPKR